MSHPIRQRFDHQWVEIIRCLLQASEAADHGRLPLGADSAGGTHWRLLGRPGRFRALQRFIDHIEKHDRV
ncbi:hypothetical protein ACKVEX_12025 [Rhodocyclaceae bacterium SMB388]